MPDKMMKNCDPDIHAAAVPSPCINVCVMNPQTGWCEGCTRTIDEIAQWGSATDEARRMIWNEIRRRQAACEGRSGPFELSR
jgi:predicted Fe-S protein YdhL (DUF1289 family)